jgi:hypothetical protein
MVELVVALLMFVNHEIKEHRLQPSMSACLKGKRIAERKVSNNIEYKCIKTKAELESNIDGSQSIKKLIISNNKFKMRYCYANNRQNTQCHRKNI